MHPNNSHTSHCSNYSAVFAGKHQHSTWVRRGRKKAESRKMGTSSVSYLWIIFLMFLDPRGKQVRRTLNIVMQMLTFIYVNKFMFLIINFYQIAAMNSENLNILLICTICSVGAYLAVLLVHGYSMVFHSQERHFPIKLLPKSSSSASLSSFLFAMMSPSFSVLQI